MLGLTIVALAFVDLRTEASLAPDLPAPLASRSDSNCDLYIVSGHDTDPFENHRFWDFRDLGDYVTSEPPSITPDQDEGMENVTSHYFSQPAFSDAWKIRNGIRNPESEVPMIYSAQNAYLSTDPDSGGTQTYLTLRTTRLQDFQSVVQLASRDENVLYASMRARMKIIPDDMDNGNVATGAVLGFFTYASDTQESDIEILTRDPTDTVSFANQPASPTTPGVSRKFQIPGGKNWTEWVDYRLDWLEGRSFWYMDDELLFQTTNSTPTEPSQLMLNLWSNGQSFSGRMRLNREVYVGVQWIETVFNLGNVPDESNGQTRCSVDSVATKGVPELIQSSDVSPLAVSTAVRALGIAVLSFIILT
ncbi:hypothetical protein B0A52_01020 [Exophiala mesophila]|uniref:GH16 domain-containing protein n=1 Tax=Exophiala mesophila TaxID=212818 RepID=A0A438NG85_EXOME|nr:hypothetical protein B0A52_01020 [Exophiala mesophila]